MTLIKEIMQKMFLKFDNWNLRNSYPDTFKFIQTHRK